MGIRSELIKDLLLHLDSDGVLRPGKCSADSNRRLEELPIPLGLKRMLQWDWINSRGVVGPYTLCGMDEMFQREDFDCFLACNMFPIGNAKNGDPVVIRYSDTHCEVGLVSHDRLYEEEGRPAEYYVCVAKTLDEFLFRAVERRYLPRDYYTATEYDELRRDMNKGNG